MSVLKSKPRKASPVFEKINLERLQHCLETAEFAKQAIAESRKLTEHSRELVAHLKTRKTS